jgi:hypothetical protein
MQACDVLHLVQQAALLAFHLGLPVANYHLVQALSTFVYVHWVGFGHRFLGNIFF